MALLQKKVYKTRSIHWSGRTETANENGTGQAGSCRHCSSHSSLASSVGRDQWCVFCTHSPAIFRTWCSLIKWIRIRRIWRRRYEKWVGLFFSGHSDIWIDLPVVFSSTARRRVLAIMNTELTRTELLCVYRTSSLPGTCIAMHLTCDIYFIYLFNTSGAPSTYKIQGKS